MMNIFHKLFLLIFLGATVSIISMERQVGVDSAESLKPTINFYQNLPVNYCNTISVMMQTAVRAKCGESAHNEFTKAPTGTLIRISKASVNQPAILVISSPTPLEIRIGTPGYIPLGNGVGVMESAIFVQPPPSFSAPAASSASGSDGDALTASQAPPRGFAESPNWALSLPTKYRPVIIGGIAVCALAIAVVVAGVIYSKKQDKKLLTRNA